MSKLPLITKTKRGDCVGVCLICFAQFMFVVFLLFYVKVDFSVCWCWSVVFVVFFVCCRSYGGGSPTTKPKPPLEILQPHHSSSPVKVRTPPPTMEVLSNQTTPHWKYTTLFVEIWKSVWTSVDRSRYTTFNTYNIRMLPKSIWEIRTGEHTKHSTTFLLLQIVKMNPHIINRRYSALHMVTAMSKTKIPI